jgi:hypothetical protein
VRLIPFDPRDGRLAQSGFNGGFVDFLRTSGAVRVPNSEAEADRMRQEVRLWRRMTVDDSSPAGANYGIEERAAFRNGTATNAIENDLLVDRLRDPVLPRERSTREIATVDFATFNEDQALAIAGRQARRLPRLLRHVAQSGRPPRRLVDRGLARHPQHDVDRRRERAVVEHEPGPDDHTVRRLPPPGPPRVQPAARRQPGDAQQERDRGQPPVRLRGLLPAWAVESRDMNSNISVPTLLEVDLDTDNDGIPDDPTAASTLPPALEALENIFEAEITRLRAGAARSWAGRTTRA